MAEFMVGVAEFMVGVREMDVQTPTRDVRALQQLQAWSFTMPRAATMNSAAATAAGVVLHHASSRNLLTSAIPNRY
jgi:hypothetical protein